MLSSGIVDCSWKFLNGIVLSSFYFSLDYNLQDTRASEKYKKMPANKKLKDCTSLIRCKKCVKRMYMFS